MRRRALLSLMIGTVATGAQGSVRWDLKPVQRNAPLVAAIPEADLTESAPDGPAVGPTTADLSRGEAAMPVRRGAHEEKATMRAELVAWPAAIFLSVAAVFYAGADVALDRLSRRASPLRAMN